ncbi:MAG TPA: phytoene desaturase family protein [Pseudomonadota bacterium]|nr:phytoene desaturase family protein [Pseudomonadota bacterium]
MSQEPVVVVGAGVGGLAAAIDLARAGLPVTVIDSASAPGGKLRELTVAGARIDSGATVLTMRWVFEELFAAAGASLEERLPMTPAQVLARHAWSERERLDLFADRERTADAIGDFAGAAARRGFQAFCRHAAKVYETLQSTFICAPRPSPLGLMLRVGGLGELLRIKPYSTLWDELGGFFTDPRLRQLFGRYATYCGASPFLAPATLALVAHVELAGVWRVTGGMQRLPEAMARLATEQGARLLLGQTVSGVVVERGRVAGVTLASGERLAARAVVLNADVATVAAGGLGSAAQAAASKVPPARRSLSALTLSLHAPVRGFPLSRHNVFFSADSAAEFRDLCQLRRLPREPTVYVCAQDRDDGDDAAGDDDPAGAPERLFFIINAPATGDREPFAEADIEPCLQRAVELLSRCGLHLKVTPASCRITSPADFERRFPGTGGALYGRATHGALASFQRPGARTRIPGLYLAGGSAHPGPGVPMATLSGRLAARSLLADSRSTARYRREATPGGTSTR